MARKNVTPYVKNEYLRSSSSAGGVNVKGAYLLLRSIAHKTISLSFLLLLL